jgi:ABC-type transport system substrate-binding protein
MTADDVKYTYNRLANPDTGTSYTGLLLNSVKGIAAMRDKDPAKRAKDLEGVKVVDPQTVEITLTSPVASFLSQLTLPGGFIVPKEAAETKDFGQNPVGTGPYKLKEWVHQDHLTLEANPDYWGGAPAIKTVTLRNIPEASQQEIEYKGGNIDLAIAPEPDLAQLRADPKYSKELQNVPLLSVVHLRFNLQDPAMSKPEVRLALGMAIDRDQIVKTVLGGAALPAYALIPPGLSAYDKNYNPFPHDIAKAKDLLAQAGYKDGIDLEVRTGQVETERHVLEAIQQQVADAGIRLKINSTEKSVWDADRAACKMQMGTISWGMDYPDPDDVVFLVTAGTSQSRINCHYDTYPQAADLDKSLAQASPIPVGPDRDAAYQKIQKTALDLAVVVPLYYGTRNILVNPRLQGAVVMDASSLIHFATLKLAQ